MGDVIELESRREGAGPHISGKARCRACKHEWFACAPTGVVHLECAQCGKMTGRFKHPIERDGEHWRCNCGARLFRIRSDGIYCPRCGNWQSFGTFGAG